MDFYQQQHQQIPQIGGGGGGGLTRYRSAPSAYFANIMTANTGVGGFGDDDFAKLFNPRASSPETQQIFTRFMNSSADSGQENSPPSLPPRKKPTPLDKPPRSDYSSQAMYSSRTSALESAHNKLPFSIKKEEGETGTGAGGTSGLLRQSSSPAGLFDSIHIETSVEHAGKDHGGASSDNYIPDFPMSPWDDSTILSDDFIKGLTEDDTKTTFAKTMDSDDQKHEVGNRPPIPLSHHMSLPKSALEKLVQDSIPCRLRAKRGFATHPRSIAERVRRNKISERTRKLQELVPNMDKQTNTADMLDLAVDYIKDLQRQVKALSENRAKCTCSIQMMP